MKFDILITQYDKHNEAMILMCKKFNIKNVVLIQDKNNITKTEQLNKIYKSIDDKLNIQSISLEVGNVEEINNFLEQYKDSNALICLNGGNRINSLLILNRALALNIQCIYVDLYNEKRYVFSDNSRVIEQPLEDMTIGEVTKLSGASILEDATKLCEDKEILNMSRAILNNLEIWHKYKQRLYDNSIFKHDYSNNSHVTINSKLLKTEENQLLNKILTYLNNINGIDFVNKNGIIDVTFKNNYLKGFIFKSGTWLEVLTSKILQEIRDIDEVKNSVIFFWSEDARRVKNELDVLAVKDSRLICVSCKDSDKYDDNALNELEVYSEKLGGDITVKILVATKPPVKKSVVDRAKEMNINLIIFDKDIDKFKKTIMGILNRR